MSKHKVQMPRGLLYQQNQHVLAEILKMTETTSSVAQHTFIFPISCGSEGDILVPFLHSFQDIRTDVPLLTPDQILICNILNSLFNQGRNTQHK